MKKYNFISIVLFINLFHSMYAIPPIEPRNFTLEILQRKDEHIFSSQNLMNDPVLNLIEEASTQANIAEASTTLQILHDYHKYKMERSRQKLLEMKQVHATQISTASSPVPIDVQATCNVTKPVLLLMPFIDYLTGGRSYETSAYAYAAKQIQKNDEKRRHWGVVMGSDCKTCKLYFLPGKQPEDLKPNKKEIFKLRQHQDQKRQHDYIVQNSDNIVQAIDKKLEYERERNKALRSIDLFIFQHSRHISWDRQMEQPKNLALQVRMDLEKQYNGNEGTELYYEVALAIAKHSHDEAIRTTHQIQKSQKNDNRRDA